MFLFLGLRENNAACPSIYLCCLQKVTSILKINRTIALLSLPQMHRGFLVSTHAVVCGGDGAGQTLAIATPGEGGRVAVPAGASEQ